MRQRLAGYTIDSSTTGTTCRLYFARRRGVRYVIKEYTKVHFLNGRSRLSMDRYPNLAASETRARAFYDHLRGVCRMMRRHCRADGPLNLPVRVFRRDTNIYKVTRLIEADGIKYPDLCKCLTRRQMDVFLRSILLQLSALEDMDFSDLDVKPENLVIRRKKDYYTACLIDYETGFVAGTPLEDQDMEYTPEFASPEVLRYQYLSESDQADDSELEAAFAAIGCAADVFSAGCIFVLALTGGFLCSSETDNTTLPGEKLLNEQPLWIPRFQPFWRALVKEMLRYEPRQRPDARELLRAVEKARQTGVLKALDEPYGRLPNGIGTEDAVFELGGYPARRGTYRGEPCLLWHLEDAWKAESAEGMNDGSLWGRLDQAAGRRLEYVTGVLREAGACAGECPMILRGTLERCGPVSFCRQEVPTGWQTMRDFAPYGLPKMKADKLMLEIIQAVEALHAHGLLLGFITEDDLWFTRDEDGTYHAYLSRPQRYLRRDSLPPAGDIDARADYMPVELYGYLGTRNGEDLELYRSLIGPETDMFLLGLIYHQLLCGRWPAAASKDFPSLGSAAEAGEEGILLNDRIDEKRQAVIRCLMAFEPDDRPHDARDAAKMIRTRRPLSEQG
ncbi:MAG: hypothetical protein IJH78_00180 [Clostridia bacterium]|nr:hypothetical protein [Clostridia bacterium]